MKISNIIIGGCLSAATMLTTSACSDSFFEQYPSNNITEANHYQTDDDFNQGVRGCYDKVKAQSGFFVTELAFRSDESLLSAMATSTQDRYDMDHFQDVPSNGILTSVWNAWYNGIYRCNDVLDHMAGKESIQNYKQYRGELLFLRSWFYFNLYRTFGVVPVTRTVVSPADAKNIARCTQDEMYALLSADLAEAASLLPDKMSAEKARVTSIAAWTLLAKVELTFKHPAEAAKALDEAMKNPNYGMIASTSEVFNVANKFNREIIFTLHYEKTNGEGHGYWYSQKTAVLSEIESPCQQVRDLYSSDDNRRPLLCEYVKQGSINVLKKWLDQFDTQYNTMVGNDFPLLRYADIYLMYAEAKADDIAASLQWLNKTRTRAGLAELTTADVTSRDQLIMAIADERAREFALEGHRWYDLVRLGLAIPVMRELGYRIDEHNLVFAIPQKEMEIVNNPAILWQNPGY